MTPLRDLAADNADVHRAIAHGRRARFFRSIGADPEEALPGPFNAMVTAPSVGMPLQKLGEALRYETSLPPIVRELVILFVARVHSSPFEWVSHAPLAVQLGADDSTLQAVRDGSPISGFPLADLAIRFSDRVLARKEVDDDLFEECRREFRDEGVVELVAIVGYYRLLADLMKVTHVEAQGDLPPGE